MARCDLANENQGGTNLCNLSEVLGVKTIYIRVVKNDLNLTKN